MAEHNPPNAEQQRLAEDAARLRNWKRWGPYLSERQWGTVREDYSADGRCWDYFPHDHARSRAYRWGEDGLLGLTDRECRLCFALALWNGRDPILKERLFGLSGPEGNHGEDVKEYYYYLDSTPTHAYLKSLYKYPQNEFPYRRLVEENARRGRRDPEFELFDTGIFDEERYFDVTAEYAKASPNDILIRVTIANGEPERASLHFLPTLWFRNTWSWGATYESGWGKPDMWANDGGRIHCRHGSLGDFVFEVDSENDDQPLELLFTENETNMERLFGSPSAGPYVKDAFHRYLIENRSDAVNPARRGTKAAVCYRLSLEPGEERVFRFRLRAEAEHGGRSRSEVEDLWSLRRREAEEFYAAECVPGLVEAEKTVVRQAYAGLLHSKQFYYYVVKEWLKGDPAQPPPPPSRLHGRNHTWGHLFNRDVISMPDKWEFCWYAAWDLAFHMVAFADIDPEFAKQQLVLFLREWYMHPNGQLPAYEFALSDVNPPVHAWAAWRVYKITGGKGGRDQLFLKRVFQKLLLNFTWWVNRKDLKGNNLFSGGFLGLDNIGVFDRSKPLPDGAALEQADGTAWMAFYCSTMLSIGLKLAEKDPVYEDLASKFFEHFVGITDAINCLGGTGLWDETDGFYYDLLHIDGRSVPLRIRSMVGLIPLLAAEVLEDDLLRKLPGFSKRLRWFLENRQDLARHISYMEKTEAGASSRRLLAIPSRERLQRVLRYVLDENEFLSPYGIRSLSRVHLEHPYVLNLNGQEHCIEYEPAESAAGVFGGNSNWRGPIWFPVNYLLIEALERYHHFYQDTLRVECPTGSGRWMNLKEVARELTRRLSALFLPDEEGHRPCLGREQRFIGNPHWRDLILFHEYFHGDTGAGLGASHQTGWTALIARSIQDLARDREGEQKSGKSFGKRDGTGGR